MASGGYHPARAWYWRLLQRIGLVVHIWGSGREAQTLYLRRWLLTPGWLPWQLLFHTFYRGDEDPDPHDHPWNFYTFPLGLGYWEEVLEGDDPVAVRWVGGWRWTRRHKDHTHRVLGPHLSWNGEDGLRGKGFPMHTLILRRTTPGPWGFWVRSDSAALWRLKELCGPYWYSNPRRGDRVKVPWKTYVLGERQMEELT